MKRYIILVSVAFLSLSAHGIVLSEAGLKELVLNGNLNVAAAQKDADAAGKRKGHFVRSFAPEVSLVAANERFKVGRNFTATQPAYAAEVEVNLFNGGRDLAKDQILKAEKERLDSTHKITLIEQLEQARKSYWEVIYLRELVRQYEDGLKVVGKNKSLALKRIQAGVATKSDRVEFDIKEVDLNQDVRSAQLAYEKELAHLKTLLNLPLSETLEITQSMEHDHEWRKLLKHNEDEHAILLEADKKALERKRLEVKLESRRWLPEVDAYALWLQKNQREDFDRTTREERTESALGVKATWALGGIWGSAVEKSALQGEMQAQESRLEFQRQELTSELHYEMKELEILDGLVHEADENIKRSENFYQMSTSEYQRGVKNSGDMLIASEKLVQSKLRKMKIIRDFNIAKAHVMAKLGE